METLTHVQRLFLFLNPTLLGTLKGSDKRREKGKREDRRCGGRVEVWREGRGVEER